MPEQSPGTGAEGGGLPEERRGQPQRKQQPRQESQPRQPETGEPVDVETGVVDSVAGFGVTLGSMFKPALTEQYPEQKKPTQLRFHGRHQLNRHPDGLEKCVGCELCAWACPADAIYVEGADNTDEERYSPGERYGVIYQINYLRCILCGLCVEACPTRALTMTNEYELADDTRAKLIYTKQDLLAGLEDGMVAAPHPMYPGTTEEDYYRGVVTEAAPGTETQRRHDPAGATAVGAGDREGSDRS